MMCGKRKSGVLTKSICKQTKKSKLESSLDYSSSENKANVSIEEEEHETTEGKKVTEICQEEEQKYEESELDTDNDDEVVLETWRLDNLEDKVYRVYSDEENENEDIAGSTGYEHGWDEVEQEKPKILGVDEIINQRLLPEPPDNGDIEDKDYEMYMAVCNEFNRSQREYQEKTRKRAASTWKEAREFNQTYTRFYMKEMRKKVKVSGEPIKSYSLRQYDEDEREDGEESGESDSDSDSNSYSSTRSDTEGYETKNKGELTGRTPRFLNNNDSRPSRSINSYLRTSRGTSSHAGVFRTKFKKAVLVPSYKSWSTIPFNVLVEEEQTLANFPYTLANNDRWDMPFVDSLYESFQGKIAGWKELVVPLNVIFEFMERMYTKEGEICSSDYDALEERRRRRRLKMPSSYVMKLITVRLHNKMSPIELEELYVAQFKKRHKNNELFQMKTNSSFVPRKEGPNARPIACEKLISTYTSLLCNRCNVFSCLKHDGEDLEIPAENCPDIVVEKADSDDSEEWNHCDKKHCTRVVNNKSVLRSDKEVKEEWSTPQINQFRLLNDVFQDDYCSIAAGIKSKTCLQVREYATVVENELYRVDNDSSDGESRDILLGTYENSKGLSKQHHRKRINKNAEYWATNYDKCIVVKGNDVVPPRYIPCQHPNNECCDEDCPCFTKKIPCEKFCACPADCANRYPGCSCDGDCRKEVTEENQKQCPCFVSKRECDPDICRNCKISENTIKVAGERDYKSCNNVPIQIGAHLPIMVRPSWIPGGGWGAFALQDIKKDTFVTEYIGELIGTVDCSRRSRLYHKQNHTYLYSINDQYTIDAKKWGNCIRFANSCSSPNVEGRHFFVQGDHRIAVFTVEAVKAGEELTLNYEYLREETEVFSKGQGSDSARWRVSTPRMAIV